MLPRQVGRQRPRQTGARCLPSSRSPVESLFWGATGTPRCALYPVRSWLLRVQRWRLIHWRAIGSSYGPHVDRFAVLSGSSRAADHAPAIDLCRAAFARQHTLQARHGENCTTALKCSASWAPLLSIDFDSNAASRSTNIASIILSRS